jgi:hypothetical protein
LRENVASCASARCIILVSRVPVCAASSQMLTKENLEGQVVQGRFAFSARRSAKHDEHASYEDMVREAWAFHYVGAGAGRGSCEGLDATSVEQQGCIATSLFARSLNILQDPARRSRARTSAHNCGRGSKQHHCPSRVGKFPRLALTDVRTPPLCLQQVKAASGCSLRHRPLPTTSCTRPGCEIPERELIETAAIEVPGNESPGADRAWASEQRTEKDKGVSPRVWLRARRINGRILQEEDARDQAPITVALAARSLGFSLRLGGIPRRGSERRWGGV